MSQDSLFAVCAAMMFELQDSHCYLSDNQGNKAVFDVTNGYYVTPDLRSVLSYINEVQQWGNYLITGIINQEIGYVNYSEFEPSEEKYLQQVMEYLKGKKVKKIILDIRTNPGGEPLIAQNLCGYFVKTPTVLGAMYQKSGKGKNDFIGPLSLSTQPRQPYLGDIPLILLTNRASYSSSSYLTGMMEALPNVTQIGQITGGGGGGQLPFELPNGWTIGITCNYFLDIKGRHIELGVVPDVSVVNTPADFEAGKDRMLEAAIVY